MYSEGALIYDLVALVEEYIVHVDVDVREAHTQNCMLMPCAQASQLQSSAGDLQLA